MACGRHQINQHHLAIKRSNTFEFPLLLMVQADTLFTKCHGTEDTPGT